MPEQPAVQAAAAAPAPAATDSAAAAAPASGTATIGSTAASGRTAKRPPAARMSLQSFLEIDDGPPRIMSLLDPHQLPTASSEESATGREHLPLVGGRLWLLLCSKAGLLDRRACPCLPDFIAC